MADTLTIAPSDWLRYIRSEYTESFIRDGGSAIKFAVPFDDQAQADLVAGITDAAREAGYLFAKVSAAETRVHMIDQLFFKIAEQMPWQALSQRVLTSLAVSAGYAPPAPGDGTFIARLAESNGVGIGMLQMGLRPKIENDIFLSHKLARDFRVAVTQLCLAEISDGPDGPAGFEVITDWLTGRNKAIAAVRNYGIFTRIHRTNARYMFESLLHWARMAGYSGTIVALDLSRVSLQFNPRDGLIFYSKAAMFDAYEMLRQFIDATDTLKGLLMLVTTATAGQFLDLDANGRGLGAYEALKFRVFDEVRDVRLVNPMGALVRVRSDRSAR